MLVGTTARPRSSALVSPYISTPFPHPYAPSRCPTQLLIAQESVDAFLGALEYERDGPKKEYRAFLNNTARLEEVVPLRSDEIRFKIRQVYVLSYIKVREREKHVV